MTWDLGGGLSGHLEAGVGISGQSSAEGLAGLGIAEGLAFYLIEGTAVGVTGQTLNVSGEGVLFGDLGIDGGGGSESSTGSQVERVTQDSVVLAGGWENNVYNIPWASADQRFIQAERFYRPNNMAAALVRSTTAALFAVRSKETGAVLGYKLEPTQAGKRDDNIIMFKLNPRYVKNGTLDGNIGYDRDLDYPELSAEASYLRPSEAYRMQSNAERQKVDGRDASELDFANSYVWTADGGLHQTETKLGAQRKDVYNRHARCPVEHRTTRGPPALLYLLLEHQSSNDRRMSFRMLVYLVEIWKRYAKAARGSRAPQQRRPQSAGAGGIPQARAVGVP